MRFAVQLPTDRVEHGEELVSGAALAEIARAAEDAGFDACAASDHPFPGERWLAAGGHHTLDPFGALSFAAAATRRLRLHTHVLVLAYRNPFIAAKAAATLDVLSGGRLTLGVAAGYLKSEFAALGADFAERNELADEALRAMRLAWTQDAVSFAGRHFEARANTMLPRPLQKPHPPLWVGGNSRRAIRRAAELADGWIPFPASAAAAPHLGTARLETHADLRVRLGWLHEHARAAGRSGPLDVCFVPFGGDLFAHAPLDVVRLAEQAAELEALGVTWLTLVLQGDTRRAFCAELARVGSALAKRR